MEYRIEIDLSMEEAKALRSVVFDDFLAMADSMANGKDHQADYYLRRRLLSVGIIAVKAAEKIGSFSHIIATEEEVRELLDLVEKRIAGMEEELYPEEKKLKLEERAAVFAEPERYKALLSLEDKLKNAATLAGVPLGDAKQHPLPLQD